MHVRGSQPQLNIYDLAPRAIPALSLMKLGRSVDQDHAVVANTSLSAILASRYVDVRAHCAHRGHHAVHHGVTHRSYSSEILINELCDLSACAHLLLFDVQDRDLDRGLLRIEFVVDQKPFARILHSGVIMQIHTFCNKR